MTPDDPPASSRPRVRTTEHYRAYFEHAPDAVIIADSAGNIIDANRRAVDLFGYSRERLCELNVEDLVPPELSGNHRSVRTGYQADPRPRSMGSLGMDLYARRADGSRVAIDISLSPLPIEDGTLFAASVRDATEYRHRVDELSERAFHDEVTGVANRAVVSDVLGAMIQNQASSLTGVAFLDLDHFKEVNDEHGHAIGDQLLRSVAERIEHAVRRQDLVARIGGDEFVILLDTGTTGRDQARELVREAAERIREACEGPFHLDGRTVAISASVGVTLANVDDDAPDTAQMVERILQRADAAQYAAKRSGRNRVICDWERD